MDNQKTGTLIAQRRTDLGLTQKQLAEQLHLSDRTISRWERGVGFPEISLLEPLADALGLSVLELLRGERMETPPQDVETTIRDAAQSFGAKFKVSLKRLRWALIALAVVVALLLFGWLWLTSLGWLDRFYFSMEEISAADALDICPFALITTEEYSTLHRLLQEEEIQSQFGRDEGYAMDAAFLQRYEGMFHIDGEPAEIKEISVYSSHIYVDCWVGSRRFILYASNDYMYKTCTQYQDGFGSDYLYIITNQNNQTFSIAREDSKLSLLLSE